MATCMWHAKSWTTAFYADGKADFANKLQTDAGAGAVRQYSILDCVASQQML